jgi:hypothetical protein
VVCVQEAGGLRLTHGCILVERRPLLRDLGWVLD